MPAPLVAISHNGGMATYPSADAHPLAAGPGSDPAAGPGQGPGQTLGQTPGQAPGSGLVPAEVAPLDVEALMGRALELAEQAGAQEPADVPIGAVVVGPDGSILAEVGNRREADQDPTAHAEVLALREAGRVTGRWNLSGCTLVVTLEPCTMCAGAIVLSRVAHVVYGARDPKAGAAGSLYNLLQEPRLNHRTEITAGVRETECGDLLREFFRARRRKK